MPFNITLFICDQYNFPLLSLYGDVKELPFSFLFSSRTQLTVHSEMTVASAVFLQHTLGEVGGLIFVTMPIKIVMYVTNNSLGGPLDSFSFRHGQF